MEYKIMHVPINPYIRQGRKCTKDSITVHNTGLPNVPAINFQKNLARKDNKSYASFHLVCDDKEVLECIPFDEVAFHCGVNEGNEHSIGIEVCEIPGAEQTAIEVIAKLLHERKWGVDKVTTHKRWNGKNCPRLILPHWNQFIANIKKEMDKLDNKDTQIAELQKQVEILTAQIKTLKDNAKAAQQYLKRINPNFIG